MALPRRSTGTLRPVASAVLGTGSTGWRASTEAGQEPARPPARTPLVAPGPVAGTAVLVSAAQTACEAGAAVQAWVLLVPMAHLAQAAMAVQASPMISAERLPTMQAVAVVRQEEEEARAARPRTVAHRVGRALSTPGPQPQTAAVAVVLRTAGPRLPAMAVLVL